MAMVPSTTGGGIPVILLKEGTKEARGREALKNNLTAAKLVAELVRTSLGPRGMDKMLVDSLGDVTITNDGAVMLKEMDVQHPAAKMMVEIAKATDNEVGDGTTSVVVLAGELLSQAEDLINKDVHPTVIVDGYRRAGEQALKFLREMAIKIDPDDREWLLKVAKVAMSSKIVSPDALELANLVVDAVLTVADKKPDGTYKVDVDAIKLEKKPGGSITDTRLIRGVAIDKEVVHAGMPKRVENARIALLNCPLEIEKPEFDAKINITSPEQMKAFLDEEAKMLKEMVDKIASVGANVVLCQKGIDDVAQHYLARAKILAVRRVKLSDMEKLARATGAKIVSNVDSLTSEDLGYADLVEERKIEEDKWVFIEGCKNPKSVTIFIRGGSQRVVDEAERSLRDAIMVTKDVLEKPYVVVGGGATEAELAMKLESWAQTLTGREQLSAMNFAKALERIPITLAENGGMDPIDIQVELRSKHSEGGKWYGIDFSKNGVGDLYEKEVFEPLSVKEQIIKAATEAACMILRIDDVIAASKLKEPSGGKGGGAGGEEGGGFGE